MSVPANASNPASLFPHMTQQYDASLFRELVNNCIAHQEYTLGGRIYIDEFEHALIISNPGSFLPGDIREVLKPGYTAPYNRNQLLADAMVKFNMIDTETGIRNVFNIQRDRYFPMPDYDLSTPQKVAVTVHGRILDDNYTRQLFGRSDLTLEEVFLLDRVQKRLPLAKEQYQALKKLGIIKGKVPHVYVTVAVTKMIAEQAQYTRGKAPDDKYYMDLIISYLQQFGSGKRADFVQLLSDRLSDVLDDRQKGSRVRHFLATLQKNGLIERTTKNRRTGAWRLTKKE